MYHNSQIKAANDTKLRILRVSTPINRMMSTSNITFIDDIELTKFVCGPFVPSYKVEELHGWFQNIDAASIPDDQEETTIPRKKFKELANSIETLKSAFSDAKSEKYTVQEEDTRNRLGLYLITTLFQIARHLSYTM